jgi:hypothetical protein
MFVIVRNYVSEAINAKIDVFLAEYPEATHAREEMYDAMLEAFNVYGVIADITRPTKRAVDEGESVPLQAESTPEYLPIEKADTTPALRN